MGGFFALLDPLLRRATLVVEMDDGPVRPGQGGDDEAHAGEEFPEVMLDLGDHPSRAVPGGRLIMEAPIPDQRRVAWSASGPGEQVLDSPLQHLIGREPDGIGHVPSFQRLVQRGEGKGRVGSDDDGLLASLVAVNDGQENVLPSVCAVDVAGPERGSQAIPVLIEDEERMVADALEVAVVG